VLTPLDPNDLPAVLEICKAAMPNDEITADILLEKTFASQGAERAFHRGYRGTDGHLSALIWAASFESTAGRMGGIRILAVRPQDQRKGIGTLLLKPAEAYCWASGAAKIWMMAMPGNYLTAGIDASYLGSLAFVESVGYVHTGTAHDYACDLSILHETATRLRERVPNEFKIRRATFRERSRVINSAKLLIRGAEEEIECALRRTPPGVFLCLCAKQLVAFIAIEGNNPGTGSIGPLYVCKEYRRLGIGRALILEGMKDLYSRGYHKSLLPWTAPILSDFLYRELKARKVRTGLIFKKSSS